MNHRMKFLAAQLKKDAILARLLLVGWAAATAMSLLELLLRTPLFAGMVQVNQGMGSLVVLSLIAQPFFLVGLFVLVVQDDSLTDSGAFWRTRPIPRLGLLGAKALLLIPPLAISSGILRALVPQMSGSFPSTSAFFLGVAAFAAVTLNFGRAFGTFALVGLGAGFAAALVRSLSNADLTVGSHHWGAHLFALPTLPYEGEIRTALFLVGFAAVVVHQYLTLRTRVSLGMLTGIFLVGYLL